MHLLGLLCTMVLKFWSIDSKPLHVFFGLDDLDGLGQMI
jgi:hypothetical protein